MNKLFQQTSRVALALTVFTGLAQAQFGELSTGPLALAAPVSGIRVDGDLSDWPEGMQRLPLLNEFSAYGVTDLHNRDLTTSDDFHATAMVGYDGDEGMLYVGVEVHDDQLYMDGNAIYRDGIELYVSDLSSGSSPVQYRIATSRTNPMPGNGGMWRNEGDHLVYEWRGAVLDDNRQPVALTEGSVIGFDVVAIDHDGQGNVAWVPWGQPVGSKYSDNDRVGRLLLAPAALTLAEIDKLSTVLGAFHRGHSHGLQALEDHEADLEAMIERLAEHNSTAAGQHAAVFAAHLARQIATATSASAIASAEASLARLDVPVPVNRSVARPLPIRSNGDDGIDEDSMTGQIINILGACALILAIGFTVSLIRRGGTGGKDAGPAATALEERIAQIETRMTDTQDVMIALSEKLDRIDERDSKGKAT